MEKQIKTAKIIAILIACLIPIILLAGPAAKIADKVAPRDATGDLATVQGEDPPAPEEPPAAGQTPVANAAEQPEEELSDSPMPTATLEIISEAQMHTLPAAKQSNRESDEPQKADNLMDNPEVQRLMNQTPKFVYNPRDLKDPMIIPWVRNSLLVREYIQILQNHIKNKRINEARSFIDQISQLLPDITDAELHKNAETQIGLARQEIEKIAAAPLDTSQPGEQAVKPIETPVIVMPSWIKTHVSGVMWASKAEDRIVLIGDDLLKEGQALSKYPDAVVQRINPNSVVIGYRGISEEIQVNRPD